MASRVVSQAHHGLAFGPDRGTRSVGSCDVETVAPTKAYEIVNGALQGLPAMLRTYQYAPVFMSIVVVALLSLIAWLGTRRLRMVPGRGQALLELIVSAFRDLVYSTMGPKDGRRYLPLVGTIFLFVFTSNMAGLVPMADIVHELSGETDVYVPIGEHSLVIPSLQEPTRNVNTPWGLGIMVFFIMHIAAVARKGPARYFDEYFTPHLGTFTWPLQNPVWRFLGALTLAAVWGGLAWLMAMLAGLSDQGFLGTEPQTIMTVKGPETLPLRHTYWMVSLAVALVALLWCLIRLSHEPRKVGVPNVLMFPLNVIGKFAEILSMSFRLFGNIFGGAVIIALLGGMTLQIILPIGLQMFMGIFVGTIQAFVFAMLAMTYITVEIAGDEVEEAIEDSSSAAVEPVAATEG